MSTYRFLAKLKGAILWLYYYFVSITSTVSVWGPDTSELIQQYGCFVGAILHRDILVIHVAVRHRPVSVLLSGHPNEDAYAWLLEHRQCSVIRGCSIDGGGKAMLRMRQWIRDNSNGFVGLAIDGPHGPPFKVKPGALVLAASCRVPVVPLLTRVKYAVRLKTWDRRVWPLPFNRINVVIGNPIDVSHFGVDNRNELLLKKAQLEESFAALDGYIEGVP